METVLNIILSETCNNTFTKIKKSKLFMEVSKSKLKFAKIKPIVLSQHEERYLTF